MKDSDLRISVEAALLLDKTIAGCHADDVAEIRCLGDTLAKWRTEILAHHHTGASDGLTEGLNLLVKEVKPCGRGFENFEHYRLRVLLRAGKPTWPNRPTPPILRTNRPTLTRRAPNGPRNLDWLCPYHHYLKTHLGYVLGGDPGAENLESTEVSETEGVAARQGASPKDRCARLTLLVHSV